MGDGGERSGKSPSGSGAGARAIGMTAALTKRAPMARKVRTALENMMKGSVVRKRTIDNGSGPGVEEKNWGELRGG